MQFLPIEADGFKVYAGFLPRFKACIIDTLFLIPFLFLFLLFGGFSIPIAMVIVVISSSMFSMYNIYFHYKYGATLGKMYAGIKVTMPDGSAIGIKQALLRSSVDIGFAIIFIVAQLLAIAAADSEKYLTAGFLERMEYLAPSMPTWYDVVDVVDEIWIWSELLVLLLNKRRRALHDFIAGTVVINQEYAEQGKQRDAVVNVMP